MDQIVIVGAGLSGAVMARELAEKCDCHVTVLEKRNHIAGNAYDEYMDGILVQKYGPHFIATFHWDVVAYLSRFTEFYDYPVKAQTYVNGIHIERPYNFKTLQQMLGRENSAPVLSRIRAAFPNMHRVTLGQIRACKDEVVSGYGNLLYEELFVPYCAKQWGMKVEDISPDVINRTDIVLGYETQLDDTDFQCLPTEGFTAMVRNILNHPNIHVRLGVDALEHISFDDENNRVLFDGKDVKALYYTGELDTLFNYKFGELPYRSRHFTYEKLNLQQALPCAVITYPKDPDYLRQTEYKQFNPVKPGCDHTIVQSEYSLAMDRNAEKGNEPYYPVLNDENIKAHNAYKEVAEKYENLFCSGRLADFRYYDMDTSILKVFDVFQSMVDRNVVSLVKNV